ncbi:MAG: hypothetical protein ACE5F4_02750, partial [Candidatus Paceibacteria bacterium]
NATTTAFAREWDGALSGGGRAAAGEYQIVARYYRYDIQPDALEDTAPFNVSISENFPDASESPAGDSENGNEDQPSSDNPTTLSFTLNGDSGDATISSLTPEVEISVSASHPVRFTRLYICPEVADTCDGSTDIKFFSENATTTSFSKTWDGTASSNEPAAVGRYRITSRYYDYGLQPEAFEQTASLVIHIGEAAAEPIVVLEGSIEADTRISGPGRVLILRNAAVLAGVKLTIDPGVIVKLEGDRPLMVLDDAQLVVGKEGEEPVIFTSLKDDIGGDTNEDGNATTPAFGDWNGIGIIGNAQARFENTVFRYSGKEVTCGWGACTSFPSIRSSGDLDLSSVVAATSTNSGLVEMNSGSLTVKDSTFTDGNVALVIKGGTAEIHNSTFVDMEYGFRTEGNTTLLFTGNTFSDTSLTIGGSTHFENSGNTGSGSIITVSAIYDDSTQQTLALDGLPYTPHITMRGDATVTIEPGVVIKGLLDEHDRFFRVQENANLLIGTTTPEADTVVFTSLKDDAALGDTNKDGSKTSPAVTDIHTAIYVGDEATAEIYTASFRYVGKDLFCAWGSCLYYPAIYQGGGTLEINNTTFADFGNSGAVAQFNGALSLQSIQSNGGPLLRTLGGTADIEGSALLAQGDAVVNQSDAVVKAEGNWWGDASGPAHNTNPDGLGALIAGAASFVPWLDHDPFAPPPEPEPEPDLTEDNEGSTVRACCSSVVFLPGLQGSALETTGLLDTNDTLWPPTLGEVGRDLEQLAFENGEPVEDSVVVEGIINKSYGQEVYQGFTNFMDMQVAIDADTGTSTIKAWEPLAYDWRYAPDYIALHGATTTSGVVDFVERIETLANDSYTGKVTIVAHSYGGLVGKALIRRLMEEGKEDLIDTFIMAGSPQLGTPQAIAGLLHGEGSDLGDDFNILGFMPLKLVTKNRARTLGDTLPSAHHLLPSEQYFANVPDPVITFTEPQSAFEASRLVGKWHAAYGTHISNLNDMVNFLTAAFVPRRESSNNFKNPNVLNTNLVEDAIEWHRGYDAFSFPRAMRVVQIAGWGLPTIKGIEYRYRKSGDDTKEEEGNNVYKLRLTTEGDFTVVYPSAVASGGTETYYFNLFEFVKDTESKYEHKDMVSVDPVQSVINDVLHRNVVTENRYISNIKWEPTDEADTLIISAHSPVTLGVTDQFGNYTGITPGQDPDVDILTITTDIPGSSYFTVGDATYIVLPNDGVYTFVMGGTGEGDVTVIIETLTGGDNQQTTATYNFTVSESSEADFTIADGTPSDIALDQDGDGIIDATILSDETQAGQGSEDEGQKKEDTSSFGSSGGGGLRFNPTSSKGSAEISTESPAAIVVQEPSPPTKSPATPNAAATTPQTKVQPEQKIETTPPQTEFQQLNESQPTTEEELAITKSEIVTPPEQTATAIQSKWYAVLVGLIKEAFEKTFTFLKSLF